MDNLQELDLIYEDGIHFNAQKYCEFYCRKDVEILRDGFKKFQEQCQEQFKMDCSHFF